MTMELEILQSFTRYPGPRYREDGPFSGQQFREEVLEPKFKEALRTGERLEVVLDGVSGYGSSFLEESFGGLVRNGFTKAEIDNHLTIIARTQRFEHHRIRAENYILDALRVPHQ